MSRIKVHPGEILTRELNDRDISQCLLASHIGVAPGVINLICNQRRGISAAMAKKLAVALGTSAEHWLTLQMNYDLAHAADPDFGKLRSRGGHAHH